METHQRKTLNLADIGDWGLGIGPIPNPQIPNPQSPIPIPIMASTCIFYTFKFNI